MKQKQTCLLLIIFLFILGSCRKENMPSNLFSEVKNEDIHALKSFYAQNSRSSQNFESFGEGGTMADYMKDSINWDQTKYYPALRTYLVQVYFSKSSTNENFPTLKFLVIRENGQSMIGYMNFVVAAKSTYSGPLNEEAGLNEIVNDLENKVTPGITHIKYTLNYETCLSKDKDREIKLGFKLKEDNQTSLQGTPEQNYIDECEEGSEGYCIDWFWQTYENGVLIYEEYLYTSCYCMTNGGGGGNTGLNNQLIQQLLNSVFPANLLISAQVENISIDKKRVRYKWKCVDGGTWEMYSVEIADLVDKGPQYNSSTPVWEFEAINHFAHGVTGSFPNGTVNLGTPQYSFTFSANSATVYLAVNPSISYVNINGLTQTRYYNLNPSKTFAPINGYIID